MESTPSIDNFFNLEKAIREYGFKIDEKDIGVCIAHGFIHENYGEIWIEFKQAFLNNYPIDMRIFCFNSQETLYKGVAPTNQHDFDMIMQLLFPSEEFVSRIETNINEQQVLAAFDKIQI